MLAQLYRVSEAWRGSSRGAQGLPGQMREGKWCMNLHPWVPGRTLAFESHNDVHSVQEVVPHHQAVVSGASAPHRQSRVSVATHIVGK